VILVIKLVLELDQKYNFIPVTQVIPKFSFS